MAALYRLLFGGAPTPVSQPDLCCLWSGAVLLPDSNKVRLPIWCEGALLVLGHLYDKQHNPLGYRVSTDYAHTDEHSCRYYEWPLPLVQHITSYYWEDLLHLKLDTSEQPVVRVRPAALLKILRHKWYKRVCVDSWLWPNVITDLDEPDTCYASTDCPGTQILIQAMQDDRIRRVVTREYTDILKNTAAATYCLPLRYVLGLSMLLHKKQLLVSCYTPVRSVRCVICLEKEVEMVNVPCGHAVTCEVCAHTLQDKRCSMCRAPLTSTMRIYLP